MVTLVKKKDGFLFSELVDSNAISKAKREILHIVRCPEEFSEMLTMELKDIYGLTGLTPYYSISFCQGDGLCLTGKIRLDELFNNPLFSKIAFAGLYHKSVKMIHDYINDINFTHKCAQYYYPSSINISLDVIYGDDFAKKHWAVVYKIEDNITKWYLEFCKSWEKNGYDYFYEIDDEEMSDVCELNEWFFDQYGNLISSDFEITD